MPSYYDMPAAFANTDVEDVDRFKKTPFFLVKNEVKQFARWNIFDQLYGEVDWQPNMGNDMKGVTPHNSPVGRATFFPNNVTELPKKDVFEVKESEETARVKWHRYESKQFNFVPSFNSFWKDHIKFADADISMQIQVANNLFVQTVMFYRAPYVLFAGQNAPETAPIANGNATYDAANSKTAAWLAASVASKVKTNANLRTLYLALLSMAEDLAAPPFEGSQNMPKPNEGLAGKYVFAGSTEAWGNFPYDSDTHLLKNLNQDLLFNDFSGLLFGRATYKFNRYPLRFGDDGKFINPEIEDADGKTIPNPKYVKFSATDEGKWEVLWTLGGSAWRTIKVGPPPSEFAAKRMSAAKFYSLRWSGEVQLTDQVLIKYADGEIDLNIYGTQLKLHSQTTHGALPTEPRFAMPVIFRRQRPVGVVAA